MKVEIVRVPPSAASRSRCPLCGTEVFTPAMTSFIAACQVGEGRALPACPECADLDDPAIGDAVECLNRLSRCLPRLTWRHATRCIGALDVLAQEVVDSTPPEQVELTTGGRAAVGRAVVALISRQALEMQDVPVRDTVGAADPWDVIDALSGIIADGMKATVDDYEGKLRDMCLELAADEDE